MEAARMVDDASAEQGASLQRHGLHAGTPQPHKLQTSELPDDESPRDKRRRAWHTAKIDERRAKQRLNRSTNSAASGSLTDACSTVAEAHNVPQSAYLDHAAGLDDNRPHNRTPTQWKTILELQLCAGCLTRTIPPHKPKDERAPCKDLPSVPYDEVYVAAIRKGLAREEPYARHKGSVSRMAIQSGGRRSQRPATHMPPYGDKRKPQTSFEANAQYGSSIPSQHPIPQSYGADVHGKSLHAPLYNFRGPSSSHLYHAVYPIPRRYNADTGTGSQSSFTLEDLEVAGLMPEEPGHSEVLQSVNTRPVTPSKQPVVEIDILGMTPATPLIPEIRIESEAGPAAVVSHRLGLSSDCDIVALVPPRSNVDRDWDSITSVAETVEQTKGPFTGDEDLNPSRLLIEKLMGEAKAIVLSVERSWTLKGLCSSPNSSEWDDATMVEEPQGLSLDFDSFNDKVQKVLRPAQSAESFFATRQGTFWV